MIQPFIIEKSLFPNLFAQNPSSRYATLREPNLLADNSPAGTAFQRASVSLTLPLWDLFKFSVL